MPLAKMPRNLRWRKVAGIAPMFLFSLPAGVLADINDRRRLILLVLAL